MLTRAYREEAIIKSGMKLFLLDSEDVFIDLLTDSGTGAVTQSMQAAMMRGDEAYSGSRSYYALAESVKNIFGYQYTIPAHQGRGAEQIYIPVLIKKREQEKGLDCSKMVAFSNYFFDTTQGHSQINGCTVRNVYIKEAFDTGVRYDFKGNFDLEGLERGIEEVGPNNVPYIVATITSNSAGGQPVSLANLKAMYSIAKKYDIPVVMDSARFAEAPISSSSVKQNTKKTDHRADHPRNLQICRYAGDVRQEDAMVPMGGLLLVHEVATASLMCTPSAEPFAWCRKASRHMAAWKAARWSVWR
ncbi:tryptophanase [Escherichia coli]